MFIFKNIFTFLSTRLHQPKSNQRHKDYTMKQQKFESLKADYIFM